MTPSDSHDLMRREFDEQPGILFEAAPLLASAAERLRPNEGGTIWIGGCGDSLFAAQAIARHYREHGLSMRAVSAAEMLWDVEFGPKDTAIGISISGSTRRTVEAINAAAAKGVHTIAVTLKSDSALARAADHVLVLPYEPISRAIPHGLDYHITLLALAGLAGDIDGTRVQAMFLDRTPKALEDARAFAQSLKGNARFFFLGGGAALGSAGYGAAKMHEAGGLSAWSFEAENFAHGAQFVLRPGDHAVLCGSGGPADSRTRSLEAGLEQLGVSVSHAGFAGATDPLLVALEAGLSCQALCLAVAEARDLDVTDPAQGSGAAEVQREWFGWTTT